MAQPNQCRARPWASTVAIYVYTLSTNSNCTELVYVDCFLPNALQAIFLSLFLSTISSGLAGPGLYPLPPVCHSLQGPNLLALLQRCVTRLPDPPHQRRPTSGTHCSSGAPLLQRTAVAPLSRILDSASSYQLQMRCKPRQQVSRRYITKLLLLQQLPSTTPLRTSSIIRPTLGSGSRQNHRARQPSPPYFTPSCEQGPLTEAQEGLTSLTPGGRVRRLREARPG